MAARSPLAAITNEVWGQGGGTLAMREEAIPDLAAAIGTYIVSEAAAKGWAPATWDEQMLTEMTRLIANMMVEQSDFTQMVTDAIHIELSEPQWEGVLKRYKHPEAEATR